MYICISIYLYYNYNSWSYAIYLLLASHAHCNIYIYYLSECTVRKHNDVKFMVKMSYDFNLLFIIA